MRKVVTIRRLATDRPTFPLLPGFGCHEGQYSANVYLRREVCYSISGLSDTRHFRPTGVISILAS